jgi:hypothetical protein
MSALLASCAGNPMSEFRNAAEEVNQAGFDCSLDVREMEFVESQDCVRFADLYKRYIEAKDYADNSVWSAVMTSEFARYDNRALHGVIAYSWALTGQGFSDSRSFRKYFNESFVETLHEKSGKKFRKRKPVYKY